MVNAAALTEMSGRQCMYVHKCVCVVVRQRGASGGYHFTRCKLVITFPLAPARLSWGKQEESSEMRSGLVWASLASVSHHSELDERCIRSPHLSLPPFCSSSTYLFPTLNTQASPSLHRQWNADELESGNTRACAGTTDANERLCSDYCFQVQTNGEPHQ